MNRLQSEWHRLFLPSSAEGADALIDAQGQVRALVLELARPADWVAISAVWRGVQADFDWPAPAIAVSGSDGFQLWFSLVLPVAVPRAHAVLEGLRQRYLPGINLNRVGLMPTADAGRHAMPVPQQQGPDDNWSAFVAPDLAPVFADTPWLDIEPGVEGQAELLRGLQSIKPGPFDAASEQLVRAPVSDPLPVARAGESEPAHTDPQRFLLQVMNDPAVALALRIEAAKALLPHRTC